MFKSLKLTHRQIRYLLIPLVALALVHFVMYKKLPFEPDYQFPLITFLYASLICAVCCEANTVGYNRLGRKLSLKKEPASTIFKQISRSLILTTLVFGAIVYSFNYLLFGIVSPLSKFLSSLFVALLLVSVETLIYIIRDFRLAQKHVENSPDNETWTIQSGNRTLRINPRQIAYIFSQQGLVYLVTKEGDKHLTQFNSLNELSEQFDIGTFFRLNRQHLISAGAVSEIQKEINQKLKVILTPTVSQLPQEVTVSRYTSPEFKKWMKQ